MKFLKSFYIKDRFFYACGFIVLLFVASFIVEWLFVFGQISIALLGLLVVVDAVLLYQNKTNFAVKRTVSSIASLHHEHKIEIAIKNKSKLNLRVKLLDEIPYQLEQRDFKIEFSIPKNQVKTSVYTILPLVRGTYDFGNLIVFGHSVLGIISKREIFNLEQNVAVMPSIIEMRAQELLALKNLNFGNGENKTRFLGKSYEFDQLKNYVHGDDPRNINWKATSKSRNLMVNHFEDERAQQVYSIIDKGRNMKMPFEGLTLYDYAINATLAFSNIVLKKHDKAGLVTFSEKIDKVVPAERTSRQLNKLQFALYAERYHYTEHNYELLAVQLRKLIPNRSMLFLYTNFDTLEAVERCLPSLKVINRLHRLIVVFFSNTELEKIGNETAKDLIEIYQNTIAKKLISEKELIAKELNKHGITSILTPPKELSANSINKYLELKSIGAF